NRKAVAMPRSFRAGLFLLGCVAWCGRAEADTWQKVRARGAELYYAGADLRDAFAPARPGALPSFGKNLPNAGAPAFDWTKLVPPDGVKGQPQSINCWAFAAVTAFEYAWHIRNGGPAGPLTVQPVVDRIGKDGFGSAEEAFAELLARGTCPARLP